MRVTVGHVFDCLFDNTNVFVSLFKQHFTCMFSSAGVFAKDLELSFTGVNLMSFTLDLLYCSETYYALVKLPEVWVRILINDIVCIANDLLIDGEYDMSSRKENRESFLRSCVQFVKTFYFTRARC